MNTTSEILTVDGVVLNTLAKNIESLAGRLHVPGKRTANQVIPEKHGSLHVANKMYEPNILVLPMWVRGCDDDGQIPSGNAGDEFYENLDELSNLFMGDGLKDVRHTLPDGAVRQCFAEVLSAIDFSTWAGRLGKFSVEMEVPDVFWQDLDPGFQASPGGAQGSIHYTRFLGSTAPIVDAVVDVLGPFNTITLTDVKTGEWFTYDAAVGAGQTLHVDCATWEASVGGVEQVQPVSHSGGYLLPLTPDSNRQVWLDVVGTGFTAATSVQITARRKYLVG